MDKSTSIINDKLAELRALDRSLEIFGANEHRYETTSVSVEEIRQFEHELDLQVPHAYREFLQQVGHGAGPYYGVWSLEEVEEELQLLCNDFLNEEGVIVGPSSPFPYGVEDDRLCQQRKANNEDAWIVGTWPCNGCLPICHQGDTFWSVIVTAGESTGTVWNVANYTGYEGLWLPAQRPPGVVSIGFLSPRQLSSLPSPPTFLEWYEGWLERALVDLQDFNGSH